MFFASDSQTLDSFDSDMTLPTNDIEKNFLIADLALQSKRYDESLLEIISISDFGQQDLNDYQKRILQQSFFQIINQRFYILEELKKSIQKFKNITSSDFYREQILIINHSCESVFQLIQGQLIFNAKNVMAQAFYLNLIALSFMFRMKSLKVYGSGSAEKIQQLFDSSGKYFEKCLVETLRLHPINPVRLTCLKSYSEFLIDYGKDNKKIESAIEQELIWYSEAFDLYHKEKDKQLTFDQEKEAFKIISEFNRQVMSHQYDKNHKKQ